MGDDGVGATEGEVVGHVRGADGHVGFCFVFPEVAELEGFGGGGVDGAEELELRLEGDFEACGAGDYVDWVVLAVFCDDGS